MTRCWSSTIRSSNRAAARAAAALLLAGVAGCGDDGGRGSATAPPVATYNLRGTVAHLDTGSLVISNGNETLTVPQGATSFAFARALATGSSYAVSIVTQPSGMACAVSKAAGTVAGADVGNVAIACNTVLSQPLALGVFGVGSRTMGNSRIFLPVSQVGTMPTSINAGVDTGSAGTVLRAAAIFPTSMVSANGFVFPANQTSMTYDGITVTNVVASRRYGTQSNTVTEVTGNLGFAQVTLGTGSRATTGVVPMLLAYRTTINGNLSVTPLSNLIGINPSLSPIAVAGTPNNTTPTPCTPRSTGTCGLASPLRYVGYADGVDKGYALGPIPFAACDITVAGACPSTAALTLGVTAGDLAAFSTIPLASCTSVALTGSAVEPVCSQVIRWITVASGGASFTGPMIFDSGFPYTRLTVPIGMSFPDALSAGSVVSITTGAGFTYRYDTGGGFARTEIVRSSDADDYSNSGIVFFERNTLLVDYSRAVQGWRFGW